MKSARILLVGCLVACLGALAYGEEPLPTELLNEGFEEPSILGGAEPGTPPAKWFYFSSSEGSQAGVTDRKKRSGEQAFFFKGQKPTDSFHGIAQRISVKPGQRVVFSIYAINDSREPIAGEANGSVSLEWQDEAGKELNRTYGDTWNFNLSPIRWESFRVEDLAPEGAAICTAVATLFSRDCDGYGVCFVDDAKLTVRE